MDNLSAPSVLCFWHGKISFIPFGYRAYVKPLPSYAMISLHKDGDMIAHNMGLYGIKTIRGSTSKGAVAVLKEAFKKINEGGIIMISPDGPRGPYKSISDGTVVIAMKKNIPVFTVDFNASRFWRFKSWDKHYLPKPFSKVEFVLSKPFYLKDLSIDEAKALVRKKFDDLLPKDVDELF